MAELQQQPMTIRATILQAPTPDRLEVLEDRVVTIDDTGRIVSIEPAGAEVAPVGTGADGGGGGAHVVLPDHLVLMPGLVDTHVHAPQWPQLGTGLDLPLEEWLLAHTFPLEARYADLDFARSVWDHMVPTLLANGTTTAVYYGSVHEPATEALARACAEHGQRALVGRVAMDHPEGTPDYYRDADAAAGVAASARSIEAVTAVGAGPLVTPIITPRFIPACTDALLTGLGELAAATGVLVQTHCSESDWEHGHVLERCGVSDTEAIARYGLLRPGTVLAHATHLDDHDRSVISAAGAGIAHCPLSNTYFSERIFGARSAIAAGIPVGLGTDIAGGPDPSLLAQCGHAVGASRSLANARSAAGAGGDGGGDSARIDAVTAFWMATTGGSSMLGQPTGLLEAGRWFDAIAVDVGPGGIGRWPEVDDWPRTFEKIVRRARPADLADVWVAGRRVAGRSDARRSPSPD